MSIKFTIPVKTVSPNRVRGNSRLAAILHAERKRKDRNTAKLCTMAADPARLIMAWAKDIHAGGGFTRLAIITLTRVAPRPFDSDNLEASCKALRDGIAEALGVSDGPSGPVVWKYAQRRGAVREYSVEVEIA